MKPFLRLLLLCLIALVSIDTLKAQTDTEFWFVAPEVDAGHGDSPIFLRFSTLGSPATITVTQPANPLFIPQTVTIPANATNSINLTTQLFQVENKPANSVLNKGLFITSTVPVTAYYEVANQFNPEIFPLKGQNALGNDFYVPAQDDYFNNNGKAAIDIVATEDNTTITITTTEPVVGHAANAPFTITLNRGETFSAEAVNTIANFSLAGSFITSNKPIAVTVSDDSVRDGAAQAWDLLGDQLVPVSLVGTEYIGINGGSNSEKLYIIATENNTDVMLNGNPAPVATMNAGQKYETTIFGQALYVQSSKPVYVMHVSGFGFEYGDALLPPITCTGSTDVGFVRSSTQSFSILVLTELANIGNFTVNGNTNILNAADFSVVPGTMGAWYFAFKNMNAAQIGIGANRISNSSGLFHIGILNDLGGSAEYGYFSNYSSLFLGDDVEDACAGDVVELSVGTNLINVLWNTGQTDTSIQVTESGVYWVSANLFNCDLRDTIVVDFVEVEVDLGNDTSVCVGTGTSFDVTQPLMTYLWQDGSTNPTFTAPGIGTYWVEITDTLGCTDRDSIVVTNYPITQIDLGANTFFPCDSTQFTIVPNFTNGTFLWQDGSTNSSFVANGVGQYWVDYQDINTCPSTDTIELIVPIPPTVFLGNDTTLCVGDSLVLDATQPQMTYLWQDGSTNATFTVKNAGLYSVTVTDNLGCTGTDFIQINVMQPTAVLRSDTTICFDANITLDATQASMTYLWSTGETTPTISVNPDTSYWVEITDVFGCTDRDTFELSHHPVADLGNDIEFVCDSIFVTLEPGITQGTFLWQDGSTLQTFDPPGQGTYWVQITDINGCFSADTVTLIPVSSPTVEIGLDTNICFGDTVYIDATTPFIRTYIWQDSSNVAIFSATVTDLYTVEAIDSNGCPGFDTMMVWVNQINPDIGGDTSICDNSTLLLDATQPQMTYLWQDGSTNSTFTADTGLFYVQLTDTLGCMESDSIQITYRPNADLGPDVPYICDSLFVTLDPQIPNGTYLWSDGSTDSILQVNMEGTYWVEVIDEQGCVSSDTIVVTQISNPQVFLGNDTIICIGESVILDADIGNVRSYLWQDGSTNSTFTVTQTGTYHVDVTDNFGCQDADTIFIQVNEVTVDLGVDTVICNYDSIQFDVTQPNMTYLWQDGITTPTYTAQAIGDYYVVLTDTIGCEGSDTMSITHAPEVNLGADRLFKCDSAEMTIIPDLTTGNFVWQDGTTDRIYTTPNAGIYSVTLTDVYGCVSSGTIELLEPSIKSIDLGADTTLCFGDIFTLSAFDGTIRSYLWQDGSTNPDFTVTEFGTYFVEITDTNGCVNSDTIMIDYFLPSLLDLGNDTTICEATVLFLDATIPNVVRYTWQDGSSNSTFIATEAGTYHVEVEDANQCVLRDTIQMDILLEPRPVNLPTDTTVCEDNLITLNAYEPNATNWDWIGESAFFNQNLPNDSVFIVTFPGLYSVTISNRCAEVAQSIQVTHEDCSCTPYVPNAFTPNNDGVNDFFQVYNTCPIENFELRIFDRWGNHIFQSTDPTAQWDGTYQGQALTPGVYVWQIRYESSNARGEVVSTVRTGDVTIMK